jgi:hypothetical protein
MGLLRGDIADRVMWGGAFGVGFVKGGGSNFCVGGRRFARRANAHSAMRLHEWASEVWLGSMYGAAEDGRLGFSIRRRR